MGQKSEYAPLRVPARAIPVPRSISPEAQAVLGRAAETPFAWPPYPSAGDHEGWVRYAEAADVNMRAMIEALPQPGDDLPAEVLRIGEAACFHFTGSEDALLTVHGGALIGGGGELCRMMAGRLAARTGASVYAPDYRLPPHFPYPIPLDDCVAAYLEVLKRHAPARVVVHGNSAGGNLAAALVLRAKAEGLPLPGGLILETPELDLTESGDSFATNAVIDVVLQRSLGEANWLYAGSHHLADPFVSPLFGDVSGGWPRTLLTAGTRDMFLSNAVRMHHRLRAARVPAELLVYEAMPHGGFFGTPEDEAVQRDVAEFARDCWSRADS